MVAVGTTGVVTVEEAVEKAMEEEVEAGVVTVEMAVEAGEVRAQLCASVLVPVSPISLPSPSSRRLC